MQPKTRLSAELAIFQGNMPLRNDPFCRFGLELASSKYSK
jgi:hypothetical protein